MTATNIQTHREHTQLLQSKIIKGHGSWKQVSLFTRLQSLVSANSSYRSLSLVSASSVCNVFVKATTNTHTERIGRAREDGEN